ncbi:MAG TPA: ATP-binding protein [Thermodesulfobacteriota bacterium]|nr:ATP-binding protein [Thermodesulfobacteriota bacterium]
MEVKWRLFDLFIHDLTGPLSIASTSTDSLLYKVDQYGPLTDRQKHILDRVSRNIRKAKSLTQEIIEILRSEEGVFEREYFSVEETLVESLLDVLEMSIPNAIERLSQRENPEAFRNDLKDHGIFVEITGKYCKSPFCHDQRKIRQILRNLMSNAMKYRRQRMAVKISGETDLLISVEDDGIGIPLEHQSAIFERFVRLNNEKRAYLPGLGLGLTGVKALVEATGGEITLESQEGVGTRFMARIPPIRSYKTKRRGVMTKSILDGKRILAVDDEPDVLKILEEEILEICPDCKLDKATAYETAAKKLELTNYDVVILDIMGVRGFDLLGLAVKKKLRVAMLTAHALSPEALKKSVELGARAYLPKEKLGEVVPFLEDVLTYEYGPGWKRLYEKLKDFFDSKFESDWEKKTGLNWQEWTKLRTPIK